MNNPTDINQASKDRLRKDIEHIILTWSSEISGEPKEKLHPEADQFVLRLIALIRTEKLKLLAEVRERVVGGDEDRNHRYNENWKVEVDAQNYLRKEQRTALTKLEAEL